MDIDTVILAGGAGRRLDGERPKPLAPLAGQPLLAHVIDMLADAGLTRITLALGHQAQRVAAGLDLPLHPVGEAPFEAHDGRQLRAIDTGDDVDTGGRIGRLAPMLPHRFVLAWCDGLADVDFSALFEAHAASGRCATMVLTHPPARFGLAQLDGDRVVGFDEKPVQHEAWISAGLFVLEPSVLAQLDRAEASFERDLLPALAAAGELGGFRHEGWWRCVDTPADLDALQALVASGARPWRRAAS